MEERIKRLQKQLPQEGIDGLYVGKPANRYYLSGFTGSAGNVLITREKAFLITDFRYTEQAGEQAPHLEVIEHGMDKMEKLSEILQQQDLSRVGFEAHFETYSQVADHLREKN